MGEPVIIYGNSGTGKTRSIKGFDENEIFLIKVLKKRLPFNKKFKYEIFCDDVEKIKKALTRMVIKMPKLKAVVIDDTTFIMVNEFMKRHSGDKKGSSSFDLFNDIADNMFTLLKFITDELPEDIIVYILIHEDTNDYGAVKISTIGKLLDEKVKIERMVNVCLRCVIKNKKHLFITQSNGNDISKSPEGMFQLEIPNDLKFVDHTIRAFYEFESNGAEVPEDEDYSENKTEEKETA